MIARFCRPAFLAPVLTLALVALFAVRGIAADPDALWKIVHDRCVPNAEKTGQPAPCAQIDLEGGASRGYAVLKDLVGVAQFLLIPTARLGGIESPELLASGAPNYWDAAWRARGDVEDRLQRKLPRDAIGLAINSASGRSQAQLAGRRRRFGSTAIPPGRCGSMAASSAASIPSSSWRRAFPGRARAWRARRWC